MTGVTKISLDSFNIFTDITTFPLTAEMFGFSESELRQLISQTIDIEKYGLTVESILARMKAYYKGYRFCGDGESSVYNASMCLYYLQYLGLSNKEPESLLDSNFSVDVSKIEGILSLGDDPQFLREVVEKALLGQKIDFNGLVSFNLNRNEALSHYVLLSILFYLGYLTFSEHSNKELVCPNWSIREKFFRMYFERITRIGPVVFDRNAMHPAFDALSQGDILPFLEETANTLKAQICTHGFSFMSETALKTAFLMAAQPSIQFAKLEKADKEAFDLGYTSLVFEPKPGAQAKNAFLLELKYLPKKSASPAQIEKKLNEAIAQLSRYASDLSEPKKPLKKAAVVFVGTDMVRCEIETFPGEWSQKPLA